MKRGHIVWQEDEQYTAETFLSFFKRSGGDYPTGKLALVWTMPGFIMPFGRFWKRKNRLELVYLPPYSPQLNIVEGLWKWLKSSVINNVFYSAVSEIRLRVGQFMDEIMKHPLMPLLTGCAWQTLIAIFFRSTYIVVDYEQERQNMNNKQAVP
ncbi:transposase [Paenibacillus larvae]|nr:transposase [Paenibacillus larvae]MDT2305781.1 transposase [Paenibacillus larvae]